ncbi:MAG: hypothetical protein LBJ67_07155 [Planctomycetaceae bacterium]|jgi:hypothetical protein|nr:hypothetical protein [Planctomycetaceae bacterium]
MAIDQTKAFKAWSEWLTELHKREAIKHNNKTKMSLKTSLPDEFTQALKELESLCDADIPIDERKMRLAKRKEQNRLLGLYVRSIEGKTDEQNNTQSDEIAEIRQYLEPLNLAPHDTPTSELARLAAGKIMNQQ